MHFVSTNQIEDILHFNNNYNYHFIKKELVENFEGEFNCLGGKTEKYKTFWVPITKEVKKGLITMEKKVKKRTYLTNYNLLIVQNFLAISLSNFVDNLVEGIHKNWMQAWTW